MSNAFHEVQYLGASRRWMVWENVSARNVLRVLYLNVFIEGFCGKFFQNIVKNIESASKKNGLDVKFSHFDGTI